MSTPYQQGSAVRVQLYNGKIVEAEVCEVLDTTSGRKVRIKVGDLVHLVNASQILEVRKERRI